MDRSFNMGQTQDSSSFNPGWKNHKFEVVGAIHGVPYGSLWFPGLRFDWWILVGSQAWNPIEFQHLQEPQELPERRSSPSVRL